MSRSRRKLTALDDPLESRASGARATTSLAPVPARRRNAHNGAEVQALFVRVPAAQGDALARAAFELRLHKQEIVAALLDRHINTSPEGLDDVLALVSAYRAAHG